MKASVKKGLGTVIWLLAMIIILGGVFSTKGDAADTVDTNVPAAAVIGVVRGHIPILGYIIGFVRANLIASLMLIIAAILVVLAVKNLSAGKKKKPANPS